MTTPWTDERRALFQLARTEGLGPVKLRRLLDVFGSGEAVLRAHSKDLTSVMGIGETIARAILDSARGANVDREIDAFASAGVDILFEDDDAYPAQLREIYDNPVFLSMRGSILPTDRLAVAIVGSRRSTRYGIEQADRFAKGLAANGITIVSGLARGIDGAAHRAAIAAGGRTLAVLASGLGNIYPPEHSDLANEVSTAGAILSEAPIDGLPLAGLFPLRNRIISGLSLAVLVIEAAERSGALSTAHHAIEQNRDVFAIPGRITDPASSGTNRLIQKGATLVLSPDDILNHLGPVEISKPTTVNEAVSTTQDASPPPGLSDIEASLWQALGHDELSLDFLADTVGMDPSAASAILLTMELKRHVDRLPGSLYRRRSSP
jgi:DNA processing protein